MIEVVRENLPAILIALLIALVVGFLVFRPRQRVRLTDSAPLRPHMTTSRDSRGEAGKITGAPVNRHAGSGGGAANDFQRIKGVGPKLAEMLNARGFTRFDQLAHLTPEEVDMIDRQLGPFQGRIRRDRIVEQAVYLARGDVDGFEQHFGKL